MRCEIENESLDVWLLGSPCHAGHTAGCHHGTFSSLLWRCVCGCCSIQLCGHAAPSCPIGSAARIIGRLTGLGVFFRGRAGRALDGQAARRGEARGGRRGHFGSPSLRETELQGHGEERQGAHPVRSVCLSFFCVIQVFLIEFEEEWGFPKRDGALSVAQIFGALIWQIGLPDRPTARPSHPPTPAHCSSLLLGHTLRHHSLFMDSCLIYFFSLRA